MTLTAELSLEHRDNKLVLNINSQSLGKGRSEALHPKDRNQDIPMPSFCGDSGWWYQSDTQDPWDSSRRSLLPAPFSPVLIEDHGLGTTEGKSFPANLPLSGQARFWNLVRDYGVNSEEVCQVMGFVDTGMTLLRSPQIWGIESEKPHKQ